MSQENPFSKPVDVNILTTQHKSSVACKAMADFKPNVYINQDWPCPPYVPGQWKHNYFQLEPKQEICYRIFRGHQESLQLGDKPYILQLEDDAYPDYPEWKTRVNQALELLEKFDVVFLYSGSLHPHEKFDHYGVEYVIPGKHPSFGITWTNGAVAYLTTRETAKKINAQPYLGIPYDLHLPEYFKTCISNTGHKIFAHSFQYGSHFWTPSK